MLNMVKKNSWIGVQISSEANEAIRTNSNFLKKHFCNSKNTKQLKIDSQNKNKRISNNKSNKFFVHRNVIRGEKSFILCFCVFLFKIFLNIPKGTFQNQVNDCNKTTVLKVINVVNFIDIAHQRYRVLCWALSKASRNPVANLFIYLMYFLFI